MSDEHTSDEHTSDEHTIIFLKGTEFLPEFTQVSIHSLVTFHNEDDIQHTIHCKDNVSIPIMKINKGSTSTFKFDKQGILLFFFFFLFLLSNINQFYFK